jgi:hypothetical protein
MGASIFFTAEMIIAAVKDIDGPVCRVTRGVHIEQI